VWYAQSRVSSRFREMSASPNHWWHKRRELEDSPSFTRLCAASKPTIDFPAPVCNEIKISFFVRAACHASSALDCPCQRSFGVSASAGTDRKLSIGLIGAVCDEGLLSWLKSKSDKASTLSAPIRVDSQAVCARGTNRKRGSFSYEFTAIWHVHRRFQVGRGII
jgi:hypothetical protein